MQHDQSGDSEYMEQDRGPTLRLITFAVLAVALVVVALRFFSRCYLVRARSWTLPEALMVGAVALDVAACVLIHMQIQTGMGKHIEYSRSRPPMLQDSMKFGLAQNAVYQALVGLIKTSMLAQYYLFAPLGTPKRVVFWLTTFVILFTLFTTFAAIFQCIPIEAAWDLDNFPRGCWNMMGMNFFTSSVNTMLDVVIFILPLPTILSLQMERKKKVTLVVAFSVGLLAIACSMVRLRNIVYFRGVGDFTYEAAMVPVWGAIECNAGIVCTSFPFIVPLFKWIGGSLFRSFTGSHSNTAPNGTYELRQTRDRGRPLRSRRPSDWQQMPSNPSEKIVREPANGDVEVCDKDVEAGLRVR
ncbi:hypothetical protein ACN47E_008934 [Coniothyrium glycines]